MWPLILAAGGLFAFIFGRKPGKTGPAVLAETTTALGQPSGTQNWIAPSGRIYRVTRWIIPSAPPQANVALALGGLWASQPAVPNSYWLGQYGAGGSAPTASLEPDATARSDFEALRVMLVG